MQRITTTFIMVCLCLAFSSGTAVSRVKSLKEIRETGVIIQQWDTSCAAAALATVFTYVLGDPVSERAVAQSMLKRTDPLRVKHRGGFSMLDMKRFVQSRGYEATAMAGFDFGDLIYFDGVIVPINQFGYNHYVIFRGINDGGEVHLADPAFGNRTLSKKHFQEMWMDGIVFFVTGGQSDAY